MTNTKAIIFDMDGTLFDFYGVEGWEHDLYDLRSARPYALAKPMYNKNVLNRYINILKQNGWTIFVNSWLARNKTPEYHEEIKSVKLNRLAEIEFPYDFAIFTDYGVDKQESVKDYYTTQVLVDDNPDICAKWNGITINANQNILPALEQLIKTYVPAYEFAIAE